MKKYIRNKIGDYRSIELSDHQNAALVSIIIPVYNGEKTIRRAIESCLAQSYEKYEIIVVDNASTDSTQSIVESFGSECIRYIYLEQKGRSLARNEGLARAYGDYIQFLDADDELDSEKLSRSIRMINESQCLAVQCTTVYIKNGREVQRLQPYSGRDFYFRLLTGNTIPINSMVIARSLCRKFPVGIDYCEDWVFWLESLKNAAVAFDTDYAGALVMITSDNTMKNINAMKDYELRVLLQYMKVRLPLKSAMQRRVKIAKRYLEYLACGHSHQMQIDAAASEDIMLKTLRKLIRIQRLQRFVATRADKASRNNLYVQQ